jgi:hypothetical protein
MTREERLRIARQFLNTYCLPTMEAKGKDYDDGEDSNANFTQTALPSRDVDKYVTWWIYCAKQIFAIRSWIDTRKLFSEPLESRIRDVIVFCLILVGMLVEDGIIDFKLDTEITGATFMDGWRPRCYSTFDGEDTCIDCPVSHHCRTDTERKSGG